MHLPFGLVAPLVDQWLYRLAGYHFRQVEPLREIGRLAPRPLLLIQRGQNSLVDPEDAHLSSPTLDKFPGERSDLSVT